MSVLHLEPQISEKALASAETVNTYVFLAPKRASKLAIGAAVSSQFKVKVVTVRTANISGKPKRMLVQRGRKQIAGRRSDYKKAYVQLAEGEKIKLFEEPKTKATKKVSKKEATV